jgi:hypothetical protein
MLSVRSTVKGDLSTCGGVRFQSVVMLGSRVTSMIFLGVPQLGGQVDNTNDDSHGRSPGQSASSAVRPSRAATETMLVMHVTWEQTSMPSIGRP